MPCGVMAADLLRVRLVRAEGCAALLRGRRSREQQERA